jgi:hypothetical protein
LATSPQSSEANEPQSTFWSEEHLVKISQSPVSEQEWLAIVATSRSNSLGLLRELTAPMVGMGERPRRPVE